MQQSSVIFANLFIAYLFFITMKGELPLYLTLLRGGGKQPAGSGNASASGSSLDFGSGLANDFAMGFNYDGGISSSLPSLSSFGL